jgi:hypothetical protein
MSPSGRFLAKVHGHFTGSVYVKGLAMKLSFDERRDLLRVALNSGREGISPQAWIRDLFDDEVIYSDDGEPGSPMYRRPYSIDDAMAVTLGTAEKVVENRTYITVSFSSDEGEMTVYTGKIFEAGVYKDKGVSYSEADIVAMAEGFEPVKLNLQHVKTVLGDKVGKLRKVFAKGRELFGEIEVPKALGDLIGKAIPVSVEIDRVTNRLIAMALAVNPRVEDALVVAMSKAETKSRKGGGMNLIDWIKQATKFGVPEGEVAEAEAHFSRALSDASMATREAELAKREEAIRKGQISTTAALFADGLIAAGKIVPAERGAIVAAFSGAIETDNAAKACFSDAGFAPGETVTALKAIFDARPSNGLTQETMKTQVLPGAETPKPEAPVIDSVAVFARMNGEAK